MPLIKQTLNSFGGFSRYSSSSSYSEKGAKCSAGLCRHRRTNSNAPDTGSLGHDGSVCNWNQARCLERGSANNVFMAETSTSTSPMESAEDHRS